MKRIYLVFFGLAAAFVLPVACSDDGLGTNSDLGPDLSAIVDLSGADLTGTKPVPDLRGVDFAGVSCGSETCGSGETCCIVPDITNKTATASCVTGASCGDGGIPASCDGPEDCMSGMPNCCADLSFDNMSMSVMGQASCTASCPGSASKSNGGGMMKTKLCHGPADCTGYSGNVPVFGMQPYDKCCSYPGVTFQFCAPALITSVDKNITCN